MNPFCIVECFQIFEYQSICMPIIVDFKAIRTTRPTGGPDSFCQRIKLLFREPLGTGKTYVAACISNALLERNVTVKMTNFNTIVDTMFRVENKTEYMNELSHCSLLIIDKLGLERSSEYALGIIFYVIDHRYRSGKPLITTTNLPLKEIKGESNINKRRIYDLILERCTPILVDGENNCEKTSEKT